MITRYKILYHELLSAVESVSAASRPGPNGRTAHHQTALYRLKAAEETARKKGGRTLLPPLLPIEDFE